MLFRSIQKVNPKLQVLKSLTKTFLFLFIVSVAAVSAAAYTETVDGLYTTYNWDWSSSASSVRSHTISTDYLPQMHITANMFGVNVKQNNGVNAEKLTRFNTEDVSKSGQNKISLYVSGPLGFTGTVAWEYPCVWFVVGTKRQSFSTTSDFSFKVSLSTIDGYDISTGDGVESYHFIDDCRVRLYNGSELVYILSPTVINSNVVYEGTNNSQTARYLYHYDVLFSLDISDNTSVEFDFISFDFPCVVSIPDPYSTTVTQYSRYTISCSNPELIIAPTETMLDDFLVGQNINNDLISKLGTVNTVDQARINAQSSSYNEVASVTGGLSDMTDFSESLQSQVDLSQDVDVLSDGALINSVNNMWDLFPWDSQFMTTAIGMVGSIALLSLVLHGGERALFSSKGSRRSSKRGDDS